MDTVQFNDMVNTWQSRQLNDYLDRQSQARAEDEAIEMVVISCPFCETTFERELDKNDEYVCPKCGEIFGKDSE